MILTAHVNHEGQKVVAIIDDALLGHRFDENDLELNFDSSFYRGDAMDVPAIVEEIRTAYMLNCAGEETISFLIERGFVDRQDVAIIAGVPYVYVVFSERTSDA
jgi:hypothetical protein